MALRRSGGKPYNKVETLFRRALAKKSTAATASTSTDGSFGCAIRSESDSLQRVGKLLENGNGLHYLICLINSEKQKYQKE